MRFGRSLPWFFALGALILTPAMADEIVYFHNGTSLPITSHQVEKDMISVELGANSRMGFPLYMVDKIESSGQSVYLNPVYHPANQALAGPVGGQVSNAGSYPVSGAGSVPARFRSPLVGRPGGNEGGQPQAGVGVGGGSVGSARFPAKVGNRSSLQGSLQRSGLPMPMAPPGHSSGTRKGGGAVLFDVQRDGGAQSTPTDQQPPAEEQPPAEQQTPPQEDPPQDPPAGS
jgi:hypothetical protein